MDELWYQRGENDVIYITGLRGLFLIFFPEFASGQIGLPLSLNACAPGARLNDSIVKVYIERGDVAGESGFDRTPASFAKDDREIAPPKLGEG